MFATRASRPAWALTPRLCRAGTAPAASERVAAAILEDEAGAGDEIAHRARYDDLAAVCRLGDTGGNVHGDTGDVIAAQFDLASMQAAAQLDAEWPHPLPDRRGAEHGAGGPVESRQQPVAQALHSAAAKARDLLPCRELVPV